MRKELTEIDKTVMGSYAVKVIFKIAPATGNLPEECVAFIVSDLSSFPNYTCYAHIGQHGEASPEFFNKCREATSDEWQELYNELVSIGYLPIIVNSENCWHAGESEDWNKSIRAHNN